MKCQSCSTDNREGRKFCGACGARLSVKCIACGAANEIGETFCGECGANVGAPVPAPSAPQPRETPKHLADKIRQSKAAVEGERKQVTVLFADVKGSMELAESLDPEAFSKIMSRFFAILTEGVERFEGFVDKFTGDGIMALFGAPIAHEDHARRACYAALHLRDEIARYATEVRREHGVGFSTRMGLNSGEVIVGSIGEDLRMDYTAQGHTVGLAQRMENIAEPNTCFLSAATAHLVEGYFALDDLGEFQIKGAAAPVRVHRLGGMGASATRIDVSRARGFSRFVGRGDEMHVLESALARARQGNAQVIGIVGEAGLGKSRLSFEFLERCRAQSLMTYETTGVAHGKATPLVPILKLFRAFFGITDQDSATTARERIAGRLLLLEEKLRESLALVFDFLGFPDPDNPPAKMDPESRQRQMFDIVRQVTQARSQKETQVMLLEDLHWFDGASVAFLEPLIEAAVGTRTLVVLNFRPEFQAPWMGKSYYLQLPLGALGSDAIREMLDALLGNDKSTRGLAEAIHTRTSGNPFFTEEVVQNLIETGKLQGTKGAYKFVASTARLEVPNSVHALLAARIDRLAAREKDVLQAASIIGRSFDEPTLAAIVAMEPPQLRESLQKLKSAEFVYEQSLYPVTEYLFKHALTQEVTLSSQLQEKRKRLHAAVANVIEASHPTGLEQQAALIAHHWEGAGNLALAVSWHRRAAEWTSSRDPVEGLKHWRKVREIGSSLDDADATDARLRACVTILSSAWRVHMTESEMLGCLNDARLLARQLGKPSAVAVAIASFATVPLTIGGRMGEALKYTEEALGLLNDDTPDADRITIEVHHSHTLRAAGRHDQALKSFERVSRLACGNPQFGRELIGFSPLCWAEIFKSAVLASTGEFDEWRTVHGNALHLLRLHNEREMTCRAQIEQILGSYLARITFVASGRDLRPIALEALHVAEETNNQHFQVLSSLALGVAHFLMGEFQACEEQISMFLQVARTEKNPLDHESYYVSVTADSCLARGDTPAAIDNAREAIGIAHKSDAWFQSALAYTIMADALARSGAPQAEVSTAIAQAHEFVQRSGGNSLLPRLRESEARLAGRTDRAAMIAGLREAETMWRTMGAPDPAERLAKELAS